MVRAPTMDPKGWGAMPLPCHWLPRSQKSHSHQGITGKFPDETSRDTSFTSFRSKTFSEVYFSSLIPQTHQCGKKGCPRTRLPLALQPGLCPPPNRAPPKSETESVMKWHTKMEITELLMRNSSFTSSSSRAQTGCSFLCISFCTPVCMSQSLLAGSPTQEQRIFPRPKIHQPPLAESPDEKKFKNHIRWTEHPQVAAKFYPILKHFLTQIKFLVQVQKIWCDLGWATSWFSREHLQTVEFSPSWPLCSVFLGQGPSLYTNSTLQKEEPYFSEALRHQLQIFFLK